MEKLKKQKHDHKITDYLKVGIFAIVLLAPILAVAVECLYIIVNKNAPTNYTGTPQNVFYESFENMIQQPLFSWTTSTGIYTPINAMLTGLEMGTGTTTLAILLTYWSLMTAIYIVFDIIIFLFTKLTHLLQ